MDSVKKNEETIRENEEDEWRKMMRKRWRRRRMKRRRGDGEGERKEN